MSKETKNKQDEVQSKLMRMIEIHREFPVFTHPSELNFYVEDESSHQQQLTVYNPYSFPVKCNLFTNATQKLTIDSSYTRIIGANSYIELIIQHHEPTLKNIRGQDKILVTLYEADTNKLLGRKCIYAVLLPKSADTSNENDNTRFFTPNKSSPGPREHFQNTEDKYKNLSCPLHLMLFCFVLFLILFLPTHCDRSETKDTSLPRFLHVYVSYKIVAAYILGGITMWLYRLH